MVKEKPQRQRLVEIISASEQETRNWLMEEKKREAWKGGKEEGRERERGAKNEVKFIRVQTDVNLFKLRDFGSGRERGWWGLLRHDRERLYLLYHCAGQGMGVERGACWCARRTPFCGKLKSPSASRLYPALFRHELPSWLTLWISWYREYWNFKANFNMFFSPIWPVIWKYFKYKFPFFF